MTQLKRDRGRFSNLPIVATAGAAMLVLAMSASAGGSGPPTSACCSAYKSAPIPSARSSIEVGQGSTTLADLMESHRFVELQANTYTGNLQNRATIDVDAEGNLLVVWASRRQEGGTYGVFGQRFDPLGRRLGTEIHINQFAPGAQRDPAVAIDSEGRAWVAWESFGQDGDSTGIYARRFSPDDTAAGYLGADGDEWLVNTTITFDQTDPAIAVNAGGSAMITWSTMLADGRIVVMGRIFDASSQPVGPEFRLSGSVAGREMLSSVVASSDGRFVTVWARSDEAGNPVGIFGRAFESNGKALDNEFAVHTSDQRNHIEPSIDADARGRFVVAWMRSRTDSRGYDIVARRFKTDGSALDEQPLVVSDDPMGWKSGAAVAVARDGRFVVSYNVDGDKEVAWNKLRPATPTSVRALAFDSSGLAVGENFRVNQSDQGRHRLAIASNARRVIWSAVDQLAFVWEGRIEGDSSGVALTLLAPMTLDLPAPPPVERIAAATNLTADEVRFPPEFDKNWVPQPPDIGIDSVGPDFGFQMFQQTPWQPPDPDLAAGPDHLVGVVNMEVRVFTKDGTEIFRQLLEDFFRDQGAVNFVFDPVAVYDHLADRFVIATAEHIGSQDRLNIAVTKTSDPMDGWHKYGFNVDHIGGFVDFENLGMGTDAYYLTADYFGNPGGNHIHIFEKAPMLVGDPVTLKFIKTSSGFRSLGSVNTYDTDAPAQYFATSFVGFSNNELSLDAVRNATGTPIRDTTTIIVPRYSQPPDAQQKGTSNRLDTVDRRIKNGVFRNGSLWLVHTIGENSTARARWYEIEMNGWPVSGFQPTLKQTGTFNFGSSEHNWFPDIGVDDDGDVVITLSRSSPNDFPYIARAVRKAGDPLGTFREPFRLQESDSFFTGGRWGDYSGIDEDPAEPGVFWSHNEYNTTGSSWRTWSGRIDTNKSLVLTELGDLPRGNLAFLEVRGSSIGSTVYFIYSLTGPGSTPVPQLGVTIDLSNPKLAGSATANQDGVAGLLANVPAQAPLGTVWLQAAEQSNTSNVVTGQIVR